MNLMILGKTKAKVQSCWHWSSVFMCSVPCGLSADLGRSLAQAQAQARLLDLKLIPIFWITSQHSLPMSSPWATTQNRWFARHVVLCSQIC
jgi:hypothetical protein